LRAVLKFNLDNPDDNIAHLRCVKSQDLCIALGEFLRNSRKKLENTNYSTDSDVYDGIEITYKELFNLLEEYNINIDELF